MSSKLDINECHALRAEYEAGRTPGEIKRRRNLAAHQVYIRLKRAGTILRSGRPAARVGDTADNGEGYIRECVADSWPYLDQMRTTRRDGKKANWIPQHRKVMAEYLGRALTSNESVHHINGNKADNRVENLQIMLSHPYGKRYRCNCCGSEDIAPIKA